MKTLNIPLEQEDYNKLKKFKGVKISWRDFILLMYTHCLDAQKKGDFDIIK